MIVRKTMATIALVLFSQAATAQSRLEGVVTAVKGQRLEVTLPDGTRRWFSVKDSSAKLDPSHMGMAVTAEIARAGDAIVLANPKFAKATEPRKPSPK